MIMKLILIHRPISHHLNERRATPGVNGFLNGFLRELMDLLAVPLESAEPYQIMKRAEPKSVHHTLLSRRESIGELDFRHIMSVVAPEVQAK